MVEIKSAAYEYDDGSDESPPLVEASHVFSDVPSLDSLQPLMVEVVTIDEAPLQEIDTLTETVDEDSNEETVSSQKWTSGVAGGVVGTLLGGPLLGVVAGGAAAYYSEREGAAGDISRALGEVAKATGEKAKELNEKHHLVNKSKQLADEAWVKVKDFEMEHKLGEKCQLAAKEAWDNAKNLNREHKILDKVAAFSALFFEQLLKLLEHVAGRLNQIDATRNETARQREPGPIEQRASSS